jgi:urease beta subunit
MINNDPSRYHALDRITRITTAIARACAPAAAAVRDEPGHLGAVNFWLAAGRSSSVCRNGQVHRQIERENDRITENLQPPLSVLV